MTQQLTYDFAQAPVKNLNYFIPLQLTLDPTEKANFIANGYREYKDTFSGSARGLSAVEFNDSVWRNTLAASTEFLKPIGLKTRAVTVFVSDSNVTSWGIHCDGARDLNGKPTLLEARLAFYELSEAPGALRWWDKQLPMTLQDRPADVRKRLPSKVICFADCSDDLRDDRLTWDDIPAPVFSTTTSCPSAFVRTNAPHHVIQGNGFRATVGVQIVFANGQLTGVWEHLQKNIHQLGA